MLIIFLGFAFNRRAIVSPFRGANGAPTYSSDVLYSGLRAIVSETSTKQGQYFLPPTETIYKQVCKMRRQKPEIVDLGSGAKGLWIGSRDAKYVMLYFHGIVPFIFRHFNNPKLLKADQVLID
jgi:hypothetical protein